VKIILSLMLASLAWSVAAQAQVQSTYRWIDPQTGQVVISDKPPPAGVKQVNRQLMGSSDDSSQSLPYDTRQAAQKYPVVLYSSPDCGEPCRQGRELLNSRGVPFREKVVATSTDMEALKQVSGGEGFIPYLTVGRQGAKGFLAESWHSLLDMAGYGKTAPYGYKPQSAPEAPKAPAR